MKPILIDDLVKESLPQCEINRQLTGVRVRGWKIAKPLNYDFTWLERIKLCLYVLRNKAIVVQHFEDMSEDDKDEHIKRNLKK